MTRNQRAAAPGASGRPCSTPQRPSGDPGRGPRRRTSSALRQTAGTLAVLAVATLQAAAQRVPLAAPGTLPAEIVALACAPRPAFEIPPMPLRITGGQDSTIRRAYAPGDLVTINAGTENGIAVGDQFYTRRVQRAYQERVTHA